MAAARARVMLINSVLESCHSFRLSAFMTKCDPSPLSPKPAQRPFRLSLLMTQFPPLTLWKVSTARSYSSVSLRGSSVKPNIISSSVMPADLLLIFGSHLATNECHALGPSQSPLVTTSSGAASVEKCDKRWYGSKSAASFTCKLHASATGSAASARGRSESHEVSTNPAWLLTLQSLHVASPPLKEIRPDQHSTADSQQHLSPLLRKSPLVPCSSFKESFPTARFIRPILPKAPASPRNTCNRQLRYQRRCL